MGLLKYGALVLLTAVALQLLPRLMHTQLPVNMGGRVEPGFEEVERRFRAELEKQPDKGVAFAAYYKGRPVVDLWGGYADPDYEQPWKEDTMSLWYSATKGVASICVAMLVHRGHLDYDKPVAQYWPEFAQNGKEKITVRQLMSHQAGLVLITTPINMTTMRNHEQLGKVLAAEKPFWEPGTAFGYHAMTFGLYASQLIRHADPKKRSVGQFITEELRQPHGIDFFVGLPLEENHRVARTIAMSPLYSMLGHILEPSGVYREFLLGSLFSAIFPSDKNFTVTELFGNPVDFNQGHRWNDPAYRAVEQASACGYGTARGLGKLYGILANGGQVNGQTLISEKLLKDLNKVYTKGKGVVIGLPPKMGLGLFIDQNPEGQNIFGHPGSGGMMGSADPNKKLGFGYVSNVATVHSLGDDPIYLSLRQAVYDNIKTMESAGK